MNRLFYPVDEDLLRTRTIYFELIKPSDALFLFELRQNSNLNPFLSTVTGTVDDQTRWIEAYQIRENLGLEYYFIIKRIDNNEAIGTVRLYDFIEQPDSFSWGSWILNEHKTTSSALESMLLIYQFAFEHLNFEHAHFEVMKENLKVIQFHQKYGANFTNEDEHYLYFDFTAALFQQTKQQYAKFMKAKL